MTVYHINMFILFSIKVRDTFCSYSVMEICTKGLGQSITNLKVTFILLNWLYLSMVSCGISLYGVVCYGIVWCVYGVVCYGMLCCDMMCYGVVVWYGIQCGMYCIAEMSRGKKNIPCLKI